MFLYAILRYQRMSSVFFKKMNTTPRMGVRGQTFRAIRQTDQIMKEGRPSRVFQGIPRKAERIQAPLFLRTRRRTET